QVALINKTKNQTTTMEATNILRKKSLKVQLNLVGEITDKKVFNKLKEKSFVKYLGRANKERLKQIYRENDIFVMPSLQETFGLVYAEAMSQGLPIVYSKGQGFDGQFDEGLVGYKVDKLKPKDIADKIKLI